MSRVYTYNDLTNQRFGRLVVIRYAGRNKRNQILWLCHCDCGNEKIIVGSHLTRKYRNTQSCGCLNPEMSTLKNTKEIKCHDLRINSIWKDMKKRCYNQKYIEFYLYGGRGITICDEWKNDFWNFYSWAIENGYDDNLEIDRINTNGNYEPNNCRWVTDKEQANNTRRNHFITINGETKTITQWQKDTGINRITILKRIRNGLSGEDLIKPTKLKTKRRHD